MQMNSVVTSLAAAPDPDAYRSAQPAGAAASGAAAPPAGAQVCPTSRGAARALLRGRAAHLGLGLLEVGCARLRPAQHWWLRELGHARPTAGAAAASPCPRRMRPGARAPCCARAVRMPHGEAEASGATLCARWRAPASSRAQACGGCCLAATPLCVAAIASRILQALSLKRAGGRRGRRCGPRCASRTVAPAHLTAACAQVVLAGEADGEVTMLRLRVTLSRVVGVSARAAAAKGIPAPSPVSAAIDTISDGHMRYARARARRTAGQEAGEEEEEEDEEEEEPAAPSAARDERQREGGQACAAAGAHPGSGDLPAGAWMSAMGAELRAALECPPAAGGPAGDGAPPQGPAAGPAQAPRAADDMRLGRAAPPAAASPQQPAGQPGARGRDPPAAGAAAAASCEADVRPGGRVLGCAAGARVHHGARRGRGRRNARLRAARAGDRAARDALRRQDHSGHQERRRLRRGRRHARRAGPGRPWWRPRGRGCAPAAPPAVQRKGCAGP